MKICEVTIENILGTAAASFQPGTVTVISGKNGSGKTSIIDALTTVFAGGHDPGLLRRGAEKGHVIIRLSNGVSITKTVTPAKSTVEVKDAQGVVIPSPMSFVNKLGEALAVNPAELLRLDTKTAPGRKALAAELLRVMPITFTPEDVQAATPRMNGSINPVFIGPLDLLQASFPAPQIDLASLNNFRKGVEEKRRTIGVEARDAEGTVKQLTASLPSDEDLKRGAERADSVAAELKALEAQQATEEQTVTEEAEAARRKTAAEYAKRLAELQDENNNILRSIDKAENEAKLEVIRRFQPDHERLASESATLEEKRKAYERAKGARATIDQMRERTKEKNGEYERLTKALEIIDTAKKAKLDSLPIPGVEVAGDHTLVDGVAWEHVNTARRVSVVIQICALRAGDLQFLVIDDAEHLDSETKAALKEAASDAGFQMVFAEVRDSEPLRIEVAA